MISDEIQPSVLPWLVCWSSSCLCWFSSLPAELLACPSPPCYYHAMFRTGLIHAKKGNTASTGSAHRKHLGEGCLINCFYSLKKPQNLHAAYYISVQVTSGSIRDWVLASELLPSALTPVDLGGFLWTKSCFAVLQPHSLSRSLTLSARGTMYCHVPVGAITAICGPCVCLC